MQIYCMATQAKVGYCTQTSLQLDPIEHWELPQRNGLHCKVPAGIYPAVNHQSKLYSVFESESLISYVFQLENTQPAIAFAQHSPLWHPDISPLSEVGWIACLHTVVQRRFAQASTWYANPASTDSQAPIWHFTKVLATFETTFGGWFCCILDESLHGHYLKGVILYHPLNLKFLQGGQPSNCQAEAQLGAQWHVWNLYRRAGLNNMHWNPCESYIAVIQNYNDRILIASVLVDRFNENRNTESSLHNYLWTVLSTSCCNSRSWPILTTPRPGSKTTRYLQNMIWEVQSLSAALETWNPGLWLHSGMWTGLWAGWWRPSGRESLVK